MKERKHLKRIVLRNFQAHKNSELQLDPHMNVIVGETNSGKSSIIRALWWLAFGKPAGDGFVRKNTRNPAMVEIACGNDTLAKFRGSGVNQYVFNGDVFKGFGQSIPKPVFDFLKLGEINFMRQLDPPFLLSKSGGEVAQYLNQIINLEIIDHSLGNIKRSVHHYSQSMQNCEQNIRAARRSMREYEWVDEAEERIIVLERKEKKLQKYRKSQLLLSEHIELFHKAWKSVRETAYAKELSKRVDKLAIKYDELREIVAQAQSLRNVISKYQKCKTALPSAKYEKRLEKAILYLEKRMVTLSRLRKEANGLESTIGRVLTAQKNHKNALRIEQDAVKMYETNKPETCPLCGQPWR